MDTQTHKRALRIRVDLNAIRHNLEVARTSSGGQRLFAVVKADAYGHGAVQVATALDKADGFAVVSLGEAVELRDANISKPILVMQGVRSENEYQAFAQYQLWPAIHCADQLAWFKRCGQTSQLHPWLKIDTGMGRLGFQLPEVTEILATHPAINWMGVMTHFASADDLSSQQTPSQIERFSSAVELLLTVQPNVQHSLANSAGVIGWPASKADWARPGIMLYGANPITSQKSANPIELKCSMEVSAPIISIKQFNAGDSIGYAATYVCDHDMLIGFAAIGYGDGLPRVFGPGASVLVNGHECPIVGRVSMDSIAIDLRGAGEVAMGAAAMLWGQAHPVDILAAAANTISYELFTSIKGEREYT